LGLHAGKYLWELSESRTVNDCSEGKADSVCESEFGAGWRQADWSELSLLGPTGEALDLLQALYVHRGNGNANYMWAETPLAVRYKSRACSGRYHWFLGGYGKGATSTWMGGVTDTLYGQHGDNPPQDKLADLGRWTGNYEVICMLPDSDPAAASLMSQTMCDEAGVYVSDLGCVCPPPLSPPPLSLPPPSPPPPSPPPAPMAMAYCEAGSECSGLVDGSQMDLSLLVDFNSGRTASSRDAQMCAVAFRRVPTVATPIRACCTSLLV
jgi:hypothetical protein